MADTDLIERMNRISAFLRTMHEVGSLAFKEGTAPFDTIDEAATALAEKDARIAEVKSEAIAATTRYQDAENDVHNLRSQLTASRAECEGLRAAAKSFSIYTIEDDEDSIRLSTGGVQIACWGANSPQGIALLKLDAEFRAALSQKETGNAA